MSDRISNAKSYQKPTGVSTVATPAALGALVRRLWHAQPNIRVWLFRGKLGSGKTTAIRALLQSAGVRRRVFSPTYALVHEYRLSRNRRAVHVDAYRVARRSEWAALELEEIVRTGTTTLFVEWPEKLRGLGWGPRAEIQISITPAGRVVRWRMVGLRRGLRRRSR